MLLAHYRAKRACNCIQKTPKLPTVKVVYCFNTSILIYQNPNLRSKQEKCPAPTKLFNAPCIQGRGQESFSCMHLNGRSQCKTIGLHPSSLPTQLCCTMHSGWTNSSRLQHLLQMILNLLNQGQGNLLKSLFKGSVICNFYHVFSRVSTAQLHGVQGKHIMVFSQLAASDSSRVQESNPLKSSSSNSFPSLCLTVNLGV